VTPHQVFGMATEYEPAQSAVCAGGHHHEVRVVMAKEVDQIARFPLQYDRLTRDRRGQRPTYLIQVGHSAARYRLVSDLHVRFELLVYQVAGELGNDAHKGDACPCFPCQRRGYRERRF